MNNKKITVLLGGKSSEREVSLKTGEAIFNALKNKGFDVTKTDPKFDDMFNLKNYDVIFNALHGTYGEDGLIQGFLETIGIPYTGCSVVTNAISMNKMFTKQILSHYNVISIPFLYINNENDLNGFNAEFPVIIKPVNEGSSVGVYKVENIDDLHKIAKEALQKFGAILVEPFIKGQEIAVGVLNGKPLGVIEIRPKNEFYDYEAKYQSTETQYIYPAELNKAVYDGVMNTSKKISEIFECNGVVRIDYIVKDNIPMLLEINTLPGMTQTSLVPKMAKGIGISFEDLCEQILLSAKLHKK